MGFREKNCLYDGGDCMGYFKVGFELTAGYIAAKALVSMIDVAVHAANRGLWRSIKEHDPEFYSKAVKEHFNEFSNETSAFERDRMEIGFRAS